MLPQSANDLVTSANNVMTQANAKLGSTSALNTAQAAYDTAVTAFQANPNDQMLAQALLTANAALGVAEQNDNQATTSLINAQLDLTAKKQAVDADVAAFLGQ